MKKFFALFACATLLFACSDEYDDSALRNDIDSLKDRVTKLENICKDINSDIASLNEVVAALRNGTTIESVTEIENGYTIKFTNGESITIHNGEKGDTGAPGADGENGADGEDGNTPVIGVKQDNGVYYWTVDGEWLTDENGNKIKAEGQDGAAAGDATVPQLKAEEGFWWISLDNGANWEKLCPVADAEPVNDCIFSDVIDGDDNVTFVLADGSEIVIAKAAALKITFETASCGLMANTVAEVGYTVTGARGAIQIEVISSSEVKAKVADATAAEGLLQLVCKDVEAIDEYSKVLMFVADEARTAMAALTFEKGAIKVVEESVAVAADATEAVVSIENNLTDYEIEIEEAAREWVSLAGTRAMRTDKVVFTLVPNTGAARSATIKFTAGDQTLTAVISQAASADWVKPTTTVKELIAWAEAQNAELATVNDTTVALAECAENLEAVIAMNNKGGNYYQMIAVTDNTGEAGTGIAIYNKAVNDTTGETYPIGKKISVSLANLLIKNYNGMYEIMTVNKEDVFTATVGEEAAVEIVVPEISVADVNGCAYMNMYVKVKDVKTTEAGTWIVDNGSTTTELVDINTTEVLNVYATKYAEFKDEAYGADKSGTITGMVGTRNGAANLQPQFVEDVAAFKADEAPEKPELEAVTIDKITAEGDYKTTATVVAAGTEAYVIADETGAMLVYHNGHSRKVGEKIDIEGAVTIYVNKNGTSVSTPQFSDNATVTVVSEGNTWTYNPTVKDAAGMDAMLTDASKAQEIQFEGTISVGNYINVTIEGATTAIGSIKYIDSSTIKDLDGKKVTVKGYYVGYSSNQYVNVLPYEVTAVDGGNEGEGGETTVTGPRYEKVTAAPADWSGKYLIVCEESSVAFDSSLEKLDAVGNKLDVTITDGAIAATADLTAIEVTIEAMEGGYAIKCANGQYVYNSSDANKLLSGDTAATANTIALDADGNTDIVAAESHLRYNATSNQTRFRYYKSASYTAQQAVQLYKYIAE